MDWKIVWDSISRFIAGHSALLKGLAFGSLGFFLLTPILAPALIVLMPADALIRKPGHIRDNPLPLKAVRFLWHLLKDLLGLSLILLGILLLFMPGQGLLTIFAGLLLTDLPGKRRLLARIMGAGKIRPVVNRLRLRYHREALIWPSGARAQSVEIAE